MIRFYVTFEGGTKYVFAVDDEGYETPESICSLFREALALTDHDYGVERVDPEPVEEEGWWGRFFGSRG